MGPLWQVWQRGFLLFGNNAHRNPSTILRSPELRTQVKGGHAVGGQVGVGYGENGGALLDHQAIKSDESSRIVYLETENARLQRLVAELLIKNEQLRQMYAAPSTVAD
jgi:hypothetical protein